MENDDFNDPPVVYESRVHSAATTFSQAEAEMFDSIGRCVNNPFRKHAAVILSKKIEESRQAFSNLVLAIAEDGELDQAEQASSIATVYCQAQDKRLEHFRELSPAAEYDEGETTTEEVIENVHDLFKSESEPKDIAQTLTTNYTLGLGVDLENLFDTAEPGKIAKSIILAQEAGRHVLDVGKMSAAIAIGGVIAHKLIKKLGD